MILVIFSNYASIRYSNMEKVEAVMRYIFLEGDG